MDKTIKIYSTATCGACNALKSYLDSKSIAYTSVDVGTDDKAREEMVEKNGGRLSVPTIDIDGEILVGFDQAKLDEALSK